MTRKQWLQSHYQNVGMYNIIIQCSFSMVYTVWMASFAPKKQKRNFQIGNKIFLNWRSKSENKPGYFNVELIKAISPQYFEDKKKSVINKNDEIIKATLVCSAGKNLIK